MITLTIMLDPENGQVKVQGPLQDRILCYGMLEMARETIMRQAPKPETGGLVAVTGRVPGVN